MIQIFTKQNYIRRIGRGGAFGGYDGDGNGVGGGGEGFISMYLGQRRLLLFSWISSDQ